MKLVCSCCGVLLVLLTGCAASSPENAGTSESAKVIGERDLVRVAGDGANVPEKYRALLDGVGKLSNYCTATHIGNGIAVAAGHCFGAPAMRRDHLDCQGVTVVWGYRKDHPAVMTSSCEVVLAAEQSLARDYAVFVVRPIPPVSLRTSDAALEIGHSITVFSHPLNHPLEWSQRCTLEPRENLRQIGSNGTWGADMFTHACDTAEGSSGSAILDDASLAIVGIHNGGVVPWNYATRISAAPIAELTRSGFNVPPIVRFTEPAGGGMVHGTIALEVDAHDVDGAIESVRFELPEGPVTITEAPWRIEWDTTRAPSAQHTIRAVATDERGATRDASRTLRVQN